MPRILEIPKASLAATSGSDVDLSSEGERIESPQKQLEDAHSVIGVSIGHAQTRLTSPQTPAAEKAAALNALDGGGFLGDSSLATSDDDTEEALGTTSSLDANGTRKYNIVATPPTQPQKTQDNQHQELPSPWRPDPKAFEKPESGRSILRDTLGLGRRRASSGPSAISERNQKKSLQFSLPSLPSFPQPLSFLSSNKSNEISEGLEQARSKRSSTFSSSPSLAWNNFWNSTSPHEPNSVSQNSRPSTLQHARAQSHDARPYSQSSDRLRQGPQFSGSGGHQASAQSQGFQQFDGGQDTLPQQPRRVSSDSSLYLRNTVSRVSSLGDDSKFDHVQDQVNSRFKAIKDSFQDSSFKLPSLPSLPSLPNMPNFGLNGLRIADIGIPGTQTNNGQGNIAESPTSRKNMADGLVSKVRETRSTSSVKPPLPKAPSHPFLSHAIDGIVGDIVIMGGYRGSVLRSAKPPHRQLWIPVKVGLNLRKVDLEIGLTPEDEDKMEETIIPSGMLTHIGPVDISRRLIKRLRHSVNVRNGKARIWDYGYDWRLSPHLLSSKLVKFLEGLPSNGADVPREQRGATVIAHSLGGLITRHAVNKRPELFAGVVYAGVPQRCVNILGPLRNGDEVLLSSKVLTAQVNFTIRSSFVLLPEDGSCFIDNVTREPYPVDFFDVSTWIDNCLSPCVAQLLPPPDATHRGRGSLVGSVYDRLPSLPIPGRKPSMPSSNIKNISPERPGNSSRVNTTNGIADNTISKAANAVKEAANENDTTLAPQMGGQQNPAAVGKNMNSSVSTTVTLSREEAIRYLRRTLAETKQFKKELHCRPDHAERNAYPPIAVLYGRSVPTVCGARVNGREGIKRADAYSDLAFASGDGVCLARAAMAPKGYPIVRGGIVASERGHVTLLGDLEGVGRCLSAVIAGRSKGIGLGLSSDQQ